MGVASIVLPRYCFIVHFSLPPSLQPLPPSPPFRDETIVAERAIVRYDSVGVPP